MMYVRGNRKDYERWAEELKDTSWSYDSVMKLYNQLEAVDENSTSYGRHGYQPLSRYRNNFPVKEAILKAGVQMGYPSHDEEQNLGYFECFMAIEKGLRINSAKSFLGKHKTRTNLQISYDSWVEKLVITDKKVTGVTVNIRGRKLTLNIGKEVVVSAGAINSPQILMLSGIGPGEHLENLGIDIISDLKVGENLQDHPAFFGFHSTLAHKAVPPNTRVLDEIYQYLMHQEGQLAEISIANLVGFINTRNDSDYPNIQLIHVVYPQNDNYLLAAVMAAVGHRDDIAAIITETNQKTPIMNILPVLLNPRSTGKILLRSKDYRDKPLIYPNTYKESEDLEVLLEGIRYLEKLIETPALTEFNPEILDFRLPECKGFQFRSDDYWKCAIRSLGSTLYHPVGTCKMGKNSKEGVVDSRLRVYGVDNLRVVDASVMPNIISGNTHAPSMMIGLKGGEMIKEHWKKLELKDEL